MRLALYARVSTTEQHLDIQLEALREYAEGRSATRAAEYVDKGISGKKDRRPGLDQLLRAVRLRQVDAVVCTKLDRVARSVRHLTTMAAELEALNVDLVVLDQAIDTATPAGRLLFHVLASIGEFEADLIRERTLAGLAAARRRGKRIGRPCALDRDGVARAKRMAAAGQSVSHVARVLGVSRATARKAMRR